MEGGAPRERSLLVLGSMDEFVELVERARARGVRTVVCDGYPDGPAKRVADARYDVDVRDDAAVARICRDERVDGIVTAYSDVLAECAARIARRAGLRFYLTPERLAPLRDKTLMKRMFDELGVPYPRTALVRRGSLASDLSGLRFPVVTKPLDAWGSHGVYLLDGPDEVSERFDEVAAYSGGGDAILVEEYDDGFELNMMTWVVGGEPVVLEIADREKSAELPHVTPHVSRIVYPSALTDAVIDDARAIVSRVARHVGLENGPLCMQFFWAPGRGIRVCECAGRVFGYEHELLELATDGALRVEDLLLDTALDPALLAARLAGHDPHLAHPAAGLYFHGYEGTVASVEGVPEPGAEGVAQVIRYYEPGDVISHAVGSKPYVVRVYLSAPSREALDDLTDQVFSSVSVRDAAGRELLYHSERPSYVGARP